MKTLKRSVAGLMLSVVVLMSAGCSSFDRKVMQYLSGQKAVVDQVGKDYNAAVIPQTAAAQSMIETARNVQDLAEDAFLEYWKIETAKTVGQPLIDAQSKLSAALSNLSAIVKDIRNLDPKGTTVIPVAVAP